MSSAPCSEVHASAAVDISFARGWWAVSLLLARNIACHEWGPLFSRSQPSEFWISMLIRILFLLALAIRPEGRS